jgi:hypothetical protein
MEEKKKFMKNDNEQGQAHPGRVSSREQITGVLGLEREGKASISILLPGSDFTEVGMSQPTF